MRDRPKCLQGALEILLPFLQGLLKSRRTSTYILGVMRTAKSAAPAPQGAAAPPPNTWRGSKRDCWRDKKDRAHSGAGEPSRASAREREKKPFPKVRERLAEEGNAPLFYLEDSPRFPPPLHSSHTSFLPAEANWYCVHRAHISQLS